MYNLKQFKVVITLLLVILFLPLNGCKKDKDDGSVYAAKLLEADEDYIDFGVFSGFTFNSDWSIIEKVKFIEGASGGWHFFRGKAWEDLEGDIAISINETRVHAWVYDVAKGWNNAIYEASFSPGTWYTICFQYTLLTTTLDLYINGTLQASITAGPFDDANNTNKLFWGGQDVDPDKMKGDLYSESSCIIAHQAWYKRILTASEISSYNGTVDDSDIDLVFASDITSMGVRDASGNGHNGINGNTPEFVKY